MADSSKTDLENPYTVADGENTKEVVQRIKSKKEQRRWLNRLNTEGEKITMILPGKLTFFHTNILSSTKLEVNNIHTTRSKRGVSSPNNHPH